MKLAAEASYGDLPGPLDTLAVAVTTLDALGVDGYRDLYLYVVGTMSGDIARDLRLENGHLIVGPSTSILSFPSFIDHDYEESRRIH